MVFKIALILKEHFREKINSYMPNKPDDVVFDFFPYTTIQEIQDVFLSIKDQYDGFYVSGLIPLQAILPLMWKMCIRPCFIILSRPASRMSTSPASEWISWTMKRHWRN